MQIVHLPETIRLLLFDIDGTLYDSPAYQAFQVERIVARTAAYLGLSVPETEQRISEVRKRLIPRTLALSEIGVELGIPVLLNAQWRAEEFVPADHLAPDAPLGVSLSALRERGYVIAALTNNPTSVGLATLEALGVADRFSLVIGLDAAGAPKPDPAGLKLVLDHTGINATEVLSIGDRHDVDLQAVLNAGGGGILVHRASEIYTLPEVLR